MEQAKDNYHFNVLVVDDDTVILNLLKEVMTLVPGCQVTTSQNPAEAMQHIIKGAVDIVFTDIHMPGVTGLEMLKDIVSLQKSPEVVVMTAFPSPEISHQAMELGAISLIAKPFEDIALVESELEKAIKKILRQRSATQKPEKPAASKAVPTQMSAAPAVVEAPQVATASAAEPVRDSDVAPVEVRSADRNAVFAEEKMNLPVIPKRLYDASILDPLLEIEIARYQRYNRPFVAGYIDLPENYQLMTQNEQVAYRTQQINVLEKCVRKSDVILDVGKDGIALIGFECNKLGAEVLEHKLNAEGFFHTGFAVYPTEGQTPQGLLKQAKQNLQNKRKLQIVVMEQEEFFGRIVHNMLSDPKYHVTWVKTHEQAYQHINRASETLRLFVMSLTKDPAQWQLLMRFRKENLIQWPVLLFIDIPITKALKTQLRQLGVRAVVNKGVSQDEFLYMVQSFVVPKPQMDERKNFRALVTVPVVYECNGKEVSSNTFTLSRDGIFIRDLTPPPTGTIAKLQLFIPGQAEPIKVNTEILYVVPYFVGVSRIHVAGFAARFIDMPETQKELLDKFVNDCLTSYLI